MIKLWTIFFDSASHLVRTPSVDYSFYQNSFSAIAVGLFDLDPRNNSVFMQPKIIDFFYKCFSRSLSE
ncbi:MAG: hypothetical protein CBC09_03450 [Cellvibrionales bacterium TMED49]|nr:hypothetical protein [Porticoccaceae bacterium]OUU39085.1 MAG: hypothetical protein CBC09_03450 [Cellvibrionales bacterium TMED49]